MGLGCFRGRMKAVAILSPQRQVAGKGALPRLSPALCGGRCQVWGGGPPPPKGRAVTPEGGQGRGGPAEAAAHAQGCQGGGRRRFGGGHGLRFGGTGDWSGGLGGGGAGQRRPEGRGGEGSGCTFLPVCLPSEGGSSDGLGRERGGGSIAQMRPPQLLLPPKSVQSP